MRCFDLCTKCNVACDIKECRMHIDYEEDLNCTLIAIEKNGSDSMTLREVADRLGISFVRVKQIESQILKKLKKQKLKISELSRFLEEGDIY